MVGEHSATPRAAYAPRGMRGGHTVQCGCQCRVATFRYRNWEESQMWTEAVVPLLAAAIGAGGSFLAARASAKRAAEAADRATREAEAARQSSREVERLRRLDSRVQEARVKAYSPMLKALSDLLSKTGDEKTIAQAKKDSEHLLRVMNEFWREALVYASDDCQRAFGRMMQGAYGDAPGPVIMRLYAEFVIAARRDLGDESSLLTPTEVFAPKLTDLFTAKDSDVFGFDRGTFSALAARHRWPVPWAGSLLAHRPDEELAHSE